MDLTILSYYHKKLTEKFKRQLTSLGEIVEKYDLSSSNRKKVTRIDKEGKKSQKLHFTDYNLLIPQDLWQAHYQIFLITLLNEFIKLNVNMDTRIKNLKLVE